ncbi:MAG TPA: hypothetical protein GXX61_05865, partial [Bacteroidales bacterium]|nr:hypothetical protein [Bacteroidales bacterium]
MLFLLYTRSVALSLKIALPEIELLPYSRLRFPVHLKFIDVFKGLSQMPEGLILDVQGNGGGYMGAALFLAEQFL